MPISHADRSPEPSAKAIDANRRGVALRSVGRSAQAADAFREAIAAQADLPELHANLALTLVDLGTFEEALREFEYALQLNPTFVAALAGIGALYMRLGRFDDARAQYERLLHVDESNISAHLAMYELEQIADNAPKALQHQRAVLDRQTLFSEIAPQEHRRLLVLLAPGDWQANVPVDFLIDRNTTTLHKLYIDSGEQLEAVRIPQADVVFTAIGESDENRERLHWASGVVKQLGLPQINDPVKVLGTNRVAIYETLNGLPDTVVPETRRLSRDVLANALESVEYPIVIRPVGSQAGRDLARVGDEAELRTYLARVDAPDFYTMPFIDFSRPDGYYRKYRIIVVDGVPYPFHLAISPRWMIHYYNAPMSENAWMREEEECFLSGFESVFEPRLQRALREVAQRLGLEYFGIDCSIDRQGRLLIFEADPAMIVHAGDDPQMFGYKHPAAHRIFAAFERLIDRARSR